MLEIGHALFYYIKKYLGAVILCESFLFCINFDYLLSACVSFQCANINKQKPVELFDCIHDRQIIKISTNITQQNIENWKIPVNN